MNINFSSEMISQQHKDILSDLIKYRFIYDIIKEKTDSCIQKVLDENEIVGKRLLGASDGIPKYENHRIVNIKDGLDIYNTGEEYFLDFLELTRKEEEAIGIYKSYKELGADLVVQSVRVDLEIKLMKSFQDLTKIDSLDIHGDERKKYLALLEELVIAVMDDEDISNIKNSVLSKTFIDVENKIRFDTSFKPNEILKDFSVDSNEVLTKELFDEPKNRDRENAMKELGKSKNLDYK